MRRVFFGAASLVVVACGGKVAERRNAEETPPCTSASGCPGDGASGADGEERGGSAGAGSGGSPAADARSGAGGEAARAGAGTGGRPDEPHPACTGYVAIVRAYAEESQAAGGVPGTPDSPPEGTPGQCEACIGSCVWESVQGCEAHTDCLRRHCACDGFICPELPTGGDSCSCSEACSGALDGRCQDAWVAYLHCLDEACSGRCVTD